MKEKIFGLLNIRPAESKYVFDLLSIQFFIGIANAFINIAAFTYFIYDFSITELPYAYLAIAGGLLLMNRGYQKIEHKFSPLHLLRFMVVGSAGILLLFWTGLLLWDKHIMIFLLLVWSTLFYMVTGYAYWGLASLIFNVRESRRVFSVVGAGDIPTKLIGYLAAPLLIPMFGLQHLLLVSIASLFIAHFLVNKLIAKKTWDAYIKKTQQHYDQKHHPVTGQQGRSWIALLFKNKLIFTISLLSILSYNVFNFIDYTFISQIKLKYKDLATLASFVATFFAIGRFTALILKLVFTSRLIEKLGIISCLLLTPAVLFVFCVGFLVSDIGFEYSLYVFGVMAVLTEVLRSIIQEPVFFILFQPMNEHQRLEGHIIAKGYTLPPSLIIVGLSLIGMRAFDIQLTIPFTIKVLLANLAVWAAMIFFIKKEYIKALHSSIARGVFNGEQVKMHDQHTINILLKKIEEGTDSEVIYALKLLESARYPQLESLLESQLQSQGTEVKKYVLNTLHRLEWIKPEVLKAMLQAHLEEEVKEKVISILFKYDAGYLQYLFDHLSEQEPGIRKSLIIHLLNRPEFTYLYKAGTEIDKLIRSHQPQERELALSIIGELTMIRFNDVLQAMINDSEPSVKRSAIMAACKLRTKSLLPLIMEKMCQPSDRYLAMQALIQYGDTLFEDLPEVMPVIDRFEAELIKIAGRVKGPHSTRFLFEALDQFPDLTDKTVQSMWSKGTEIQKVAQIHRFQHLLYSYLKRGADKIVYHLEMPYFTGQDLVLSSMKSEIHNDLVTSLKICALLYHRKEMNRVLELVESGEKQRLYNAMEMLEMLLPAKVGKQINMLIDYLLDPASVNRKHLTISEPAAYFDRVVISQATHFNAWTRAVCLFCSLKNREIKFIRSLEHATLPKETAIIKETKHYVIQSIEQAAYAHH